MHKIKLYSRHHLDVVQIRRTGFCHWSSSLHICIKCRGPAWIDFACTLAVTALTSFVWLKRIGQEQHLGIHRNNYTYISVRFVSRMFRIAMQRMFSRISITEVIVTFFTQVAVPWVCYWWTNALNLCHRLLTGVPMKGTSVKSCRYGRTVKFLSTANGIFPEDK